MSLSDVRSIIPVFVPHLGCPNDCVFCNQRRISGAMESATPETVREAVEYAARATERKRPRQLAFYGGSFTAIPAAEQESLLSAAYEYIQSGEIDSIRLSTRPDAIDGAVLSRLKRYGVKTVELGAQSLDDEVLKLSGRGHTAQDVESAAATVKNAGFELVIQMMTGLPGDTKEKSVATAKKIIAMNPDGVRIYPTVIVKDTALFDLWKAGRYSEHTVDEAVDWCSDILPLFEAAGITVIRLGLNPTDELSSGTAAGGAYHPSLGELVRSEVIYKNIAFRLSQMGNTEGKILRISVPAGMVSKVIGQKKRNKLKLLENFGLSDVEVIQGGTGITVELI